MVRTMTGDERASAGNVNVKLVSTIYGIQSRFGGETGSRIVGFVGALVITAIEEFIFGLSPCNN